MADESVRSTHETHADRAFETYVVLDRVRHTRRAMTAADEEPVEPADAFAALGDPLRVEILQALAAHHREHPRSPAVRFSELRRAVDVRDSGRFRYHLERLRGAFVEKTDEGYRLTYAGRRVVTAVVAGTYTGRETLGPIELDSRCSFCDTPAHARYDDGLLSVACENDHPLFLWGLPPNAADGRSIEEVAALATTLAFHSYELVTGGTCSECYSRVERGVHRVGVEKGGSGDGAGPESEEVVGQRIRFTARCDECGAWWDVPVGFALVGHPAVESLYDRGDRSIRERYWWELEFVSAAARVDRVEEEPLRVAISAALDDGDLRATVDATGQVVDVEYRE